MRSEKKWIAYVGPFPFPWGQAASRRMFGIAQSFAEGGYDVVVASGEAGPIIPKVVRDCGAGTVFRVGLSELPAPGTGLFRKGVRAFFSWGARTVRWLNSMPAPALVLVYGGGAPYASRLLRWGRKNNVPIAFDVVEWYEASHVPGGMLNPFIISSEFCMRGLYPRADGIIAISSYLEEHYSPAVEPVVRVPPTLDVRALDSAGYARSSKMPYRLVYAGTPGKKDALPLILAAVAEADPEGNRIVIEVIGVDAREGSTVTSGSGSSPGVRFLGRIPQSEVAAHVRDADFSVLLRESERFASAGFPTKFVESLSAGTPVISNLTSDLGRYLIDGVNGIVVDECSVDALVCAFREMMLLGTEELERMRIEARRVALEAFDYRNYREVLVEFAQRLERAM